MRPVHKKAVQRWRGLFRRRFRGHPDRDENPGQLDAEFGHITGGRIGGECASVLLVQAGEIGRVGQQNADFRNVVVSGAARFQDRQAVGDGLASLLLDRPAGKGTGRRVSAGHPGDVDVITNPNALAIEGRAGGPVGTNQLSAHAGIIPVGRLLGPVGGYQDRRVVFTDRYTNGFTVTGRSTITKHLMGRGIRVELRVSLGDSNP